MVNRDRKHFKLINYKDLVHGHSFSFDSQPYLSDMFSELRSSDQNSVLCLVLGAGVSMDAGLPSWVKLVKFLADQIGDTHLEYFALNAPDDIARRAEVIMGIIGWPLEDDWTTIGLRLREGLYQKNALTQPGSLALSIARLVKSYPGKVRILTTNYDSLLENALHTVECDTAAFSLDDEEGWREYVGHGVPVLHLHGYIPQVGDIKGPLVLTESQFLQYGSRVRKIIADNIVDATALMIGLGFADPNLIGALYASRHSDVSVSAKANYALNIAGTIVDESEDEEEAARFHVESAQYLEKLSVHPILLKSYSQLNQVVNDLTLAIRFPDEYLFDEFANSENSLAYGHRLNRYLQTCYTAIGCEEGSYVPTGDAAAELSSRLAQALEEPERYLTEMTGRYGVHYDTPNAENFQLCLWLRRLDAAAGKPAYALDLMGSSAFHHREPWSIRRDVKISVRSPYAAAQAVFRGMIISTNLEPGKNAGILRGVLALPLRISLAPVSSTADSVTVNDVFDDQILVGALTLDSSYYVDPYHEDSTPVEKKELGVIAYLKKDETEKLIDLVYSQVSELLFGST